MSKLLIDENPLILLPSLAKAIGLHEAIIIQQIHYWIEHHGPDGKRYGQVEEGKRWIRNTVADWKKSNFCFFSNSQIYRTLKSLEKQDLVTSRKDLNKTGYDRTKWYTINYPILRQREMDFINTQNGFDSSEDTIPETTTETTPIFKEKFLENYKEALIMGALYTTHEYWHEYCTQAPGWRVATPKYLKRFKTRIKEESFRSNLGIILCKIKDNPKLQEQGWFDFYWVLSKSKEEAHYKRILKGKYDWMIEDREELSPSHSSNLPTSTPDLPTVMSTEQISKIQA